VDAGERSYGPRYNRLPLFFSSSTLLSFSRVSSSVSFPQQYCHSYSGGATTTTTTTTTTIVTFIGIFGSSPFSFFFFLDPP
jgi:carbohydrate-binding DOMON domain-containing protein